jgi:hypothetical protein
MPIVKVSNQTGKCVSVVNYEDHTQYSCNNLPKKYERQVVR